VMQTKPSDQQLQLEAGVTPDRERLMLTLLVEGKLTMRMEMTPEQADLHLSVMTSYRNMLVDKLPVPEATWQKH
jgi:hypothetical protein